MSNINRTPIKHSPEIEFHLGSTQGIVETTCGKQLVILEAEDKPNHYNIILKSNGNIQYQGQFDKKSQIGIASRHPKHTKNLYSV